MASTRKLILELVADAAAFERGLSRSERSLKKFKNDADKAGGKKGVLGSFLSGRGGAIAGGAALGGAAVAVSFLKKSIDAAKDAQAAEIRLNQSVKALNLTKRQRIAIDKQISATSRRAAIDDEDLSDVYAKLARTTGDWKKAMDGTNLAADIARARNVSLESAAKAVEKAYLGSEAGLKRFGISVLKSNDHVLAAEATIDSWRDKNGKLTESEDLKAAALKKSARELDKQAAAQEAIATAQKKFAGSAEEYGKSAAGAQEKLAVAFENLQEAIGEKLLPAFTDLTLKLVEAVEAANEFFDVLQKITQIKLPGGRAGDLIRFLITRAPGPGGGIKTAFDVGQALTTQAGNTPAQTRGAPVIGLRGAPVVVKTDVILDGQKVATSTTTHQQRKDARNPNGRRGATR